MLLLIVVGLQINGPLSPLALHEVYGVKLWVFFPEFRHGHLFSLYDRFRRGLYGPYEGTVRIRSCGAEAVHTGLAQLFRGMVLPDIDETLLILFCSTVQIVHHSARGR